MDYTAMQFWFNVVFGVANLLLWLYVWRSNKDKATNTKIDQMEKNFGEKIGELQEEMGRQDERLKKAIGHPELEPIHKRINGIDKKMSEVAGEMKGMNRILNLIHEHMLKGGE